jgi:hypothetical protein
MLENTNRPIELDLWIAQHQIGIEYQGRIDRFHFSFVFSISRSSPFHEYGYCVWIERNWQLFRTRYREGSIMSITRNYIDYHSLLVCLMFSFFSCFVFFIC